MRGSQKNKDYKVIWNSEFAYAIGLITSDGCLSKNKRTINFTSKDRDLIETFKKCLDLENKIGHKFRSNERTTKYWQVQFSNKILYKYLEEIGLTSRKSKILSALNVPNEYFFDFLRGYLDGDGCIRSFKDPVFTNSQRLYTVFYSASLPYLKWLQKNLNLLLGIHGFMEKMTREYRLTFAKKESLKLLPLIYQRKEAPCLKRKYIIAEPFLV